MVSTTIPTNLKPHKLNYQYNMVNSCRSVFLNDELVLLEFVYKDL